MAKYLVNDAAVAHCRELIEKRQYVLDSDWGEVQPGAEAQNGFLEKHSWAEYAAWHLGLSDGANDETRPPADRPSGQRRRAYEGERSEMYGARRRAVRHS